VPISIFAVLNTTQVGNMYSSGDVRNDYYKTLTIAQVVNRRVDGSELHQLTRRVADILFQRAPLAPPVPTL